MPRPKNPELKKEMLAQARELFRKEGYRKASYAEIAKATGTTKGLLQYYFPKKEQLATSLMTEVLEGARAALGYGERPERGSVEACQHLYRIGHVFFCYLLGEGGYAQFLQDVTSDFDLVETVLAFDLGWALDYAQMGERTGETKIEESVVMAMGGFYALLHYDLGHGIEVDVRYHLRTVMREFMHATGFGDREATDALIEAELTDAEIGQALSTMRAQLGTPRGV